MHEFGDVENALKTWVAGTGVGPLVTRPDLGKNVYLAMPASSPLPAVVITRIGGGPTPRKELPEDRARISFDLWGRSRAECAAILARLLSELDWLGVGGGAVVGDVTLLTAEILSVRWLPDPDSDTPRHVVDALITTLAG